MQQWSYAATRYLSILQIVGTHLGVIIVSEVVMDVVLLTLGVLSEITDNNTC